VPLLETDESLRSILVNAKTIAVLGLSDKLHRDSYDVAKFMRSLGYEIIPVNPLVEQVFGIPSYRRLEDIPNPPDIVNVFRRPEHLPGIVEAAMKTGANTIWLQFNTYHEQAVQRALDAGMNVVVERCIKVECIRLGITHAPEISR
jgi:predicted CoA-binding protein